MCKAVKFTSQLLSLWYTADVLFVYTFVVFVILTKFDALLEHSAVIL